MMNPSATEALTQPEAVSQPTEKSPTKQLSSNALDQWRGVALLSVLIGHGFLHTGRTQGLGRGTGVNLFFFISGVLVFRSLNKGALKSKTFVTDFWWRRFRRLYPALIVYVLGMIPVLLLVHSVVPDVDSASVLSLLKSIPIDLTFLVDYITTFSTVSGHLWSISCEMQFYLVAPLIFLAGGKSDRRRLWVFGLLLIFQIILGMVGILTLGAREQYKYHFEFSVWPMMLGFFVESRKEWFASAARRFKMPGILLTVTGGLLLVLNSLFFNKHHVISEILGCCCGLIFMSACYLCYLSGASLKNLPGRALGWIGERTYSIYLWQQPLAFCNFVPTAWHPIGALASIGIGAISFHFAERPFLSESRKKQITPTQQR